MKSNLICLAVFFISGTAMPAFAQNSAYEKQAMQEKAIFNSSMETGQSATYEQVMKDPDNLKLNMAYVRTQIRLGDVKGAAATLERMLRIKPNLAEVRLFYAAVLYRLDNIPEAKLELSKLDREKLSEKTLKEKQVLEKMIARREKRTTWTWQLSAGIMSDTNRNAFPEDDTIVYPNGSTLKFEGKEKADISYMAMAAIDIDRKTGQYGQHSVFAGGSYYMTKQSDLSYLDMGIISGKAGFNFNTRKNTITPQLVYNTVSLDGSSYMDTAGASVKLSHSLDKKTALYAEGRCLSQSYKNSSAYRNNSEKNGYAAAGTLGMRRLITPRMTIEAEALGIAKDAKTDSYDTTTIGANLRHFWLFRKNAYLMTGFSLSQESYKKQSLMDSLFFGKKRKDSVMRGSLTLGFPLYKTISASIAYEYYHNSSNIQAYTYSNHKGTGLISWKFSI